MKTYHKEKVYLIELTGTEIEDLRALLVDAHDYNIEHNYPISVVQAKVFMHMLDVGWAVEKLFDVDK